MNLMNLDNSLGLWRADVYITDLYHPDDSIFNIYGDVTLSHRTGKQREKTIWKPSFRYPFSSIQIWVPEEDFRGTARNVLLAGERGHEYVEVYGVANTVNGMLTRAYEKQKFPKPNLEQIEMLLEPIIKQYQIYSDIVIARLRGK